MKILFTSDLHEDMGAFKRFVRILNALDFDYGYDCGVIAGDLIDETPTMPKIDHTTDPLPINDSIPELPGADEDDDNSFSDDLLVVDRDEKFDLLRRLYNPEGATRKLLRRKEKAFKDILGQSFKPIFLIPGNHDKTEWDDYNNVYNIHGRKFRYMDYNFVGYRYAALFDKFEEEISADMEILKDLVDSKTIFVTHNPARGILDYGQGSSSIRKLVQERKPLYHLFGHVHGGFGWEDNLMDGVSVGSVNGAYPMKRKFVGINLEAELVKRVLI